jgi:hypothetical protein
MRKTFLMTIKSIPKNTPYCYDSDTNKYCPYFRMRIRGKHSKKVSSTPGCYEYCKFLKKALSIGDSCKDCSID